MLCQSGVKVLTHKTAKSSQDELDEREMITELRTAPFGSLSRSSFLNSLTEM